MAPKPAQDKVIALREEGLSEEDVRKRLREEGYKAGRISQLIKATRVQARLLQNQQAKEDHRFALAWQEGRPLRRPAGGPLHRPALQQVQFCNVLTDVVRGAVRT